MANLGLDDGTKWAVGPVTTRDGIVYPKAFLSCHPTLRHIYEERFVAFADRDLVVFQNERYTFRQVKILVDALGHSLQKQFGIKHGDRVGIAMRNCPEWCISFIAITTIGAIAVPINSLWKENEYAYGLKDSQCLVLICDEPRYRSACQSCQDLNIAIITTRFGKKHPPFDAAMFSDVIRTNLGERPSLNEPLGPDDVACIMYTSGSTGTPKGVVQTHRGITQQLALCQRRYEQRATELDAYKGRKAVFSNTRTSTMHFNKLPLPLGSLTPCTICPVPLFHVTGSHHQFLHSVSIGRKLVLMPKWDVLDCLRLIEQERVTEFFGVPTMVLDMLNHPAFRSFDTSSLSNVGGGGAKTPAFVVSKVPEQFKNGLPQQGYGLTETNGGVVMIDRRSYMKKPDAIGRPDVIIEVAIRDPNTGTMMRGGQTGEIWIRGPTLMRGYWNKPEKTAEVLDEDGWFATGDLGLQDADGDVFIVDRKKDLIIRGGENISAAEVEAAFIATGKVRECAAFGIPDERLGELVGLVAVPLTEITAEELCTEVSKQIARFKVPKCEHTILTSESLPRTGSEKIQKKLVKQSFLDRIMGGEKTPRARL